MKIFGLDFTSSPGPEKPITLAEGEVVRHSLCITRLDQLPSFQEFESFLTSGGQWIAALDFPFGQPELMVKELSWPLAWKDYVGLVGSMKREDFRVILEKYRREHPWGSKQLLRATDRRANALSPMMWYGVPLARMFFEGSPRLLRSNLSVVPCRPNSRSQIAIEGYPALVARKYLGRGRYKDHHRPASEGPMLRRRLLQQLGSQEARSPYGLGFGLNPGIADECIQDDRGDKLDAVLCALQAAWAYSRRRFSFGIPLCCNPDEGWIVDPAMAR